MLQRALTLVCVAVLTVNLALPSRAGGEPLDELARGVDRAESMRAIKNLQRTYAQYSQFGLWREMAELFAEDGTFIFDEHRVQGRAGIAEYLKTQEGGGREGLAPGAVHAEIIDQPVANLSIDGESAKGRWYGFLLISDDRGHASIRGGVFENEYVRRDGRWQIGVHRYFPQYAGPYETGWINWLGNDVGILPYHFSPDESGIPIPTPVGTAPKAQATLDELMERIAVMNDEGLVRNLQAAYGYYVNRRMWDDVNDLFAADGVYELGGNGIYVGRDGVRKAHERMGPAGLTDGILNDRLQFDTVVQLAPGRREAHVRGLELGLLGDANSGKGYWEVSVYDNRFVKEDGLWKVREMRVFPLFKADYSEGWGESRLAETLTGALKPARPLPSEDRVEQDRAVPAFVSVHPVTGKPIAAPAGQRLVAARALTGEIAVPMVKRPAADMETAERRLRMATAYDAAEHVSSAYGFFADDSQWDWLSELFGKTGTKQIPFAGYYTSFPRISKALFLEYGDPVALDAKKAAIAFHWRIQPVITVAPDGRSARVRSPSIRRASRCHS